MSNPTSGETVEQKLPHRPVWWHKLIPACLAALSAAASGLLVLQHLAGMALPGCGPTSACAQLSASPWGSVLGVPVSYVGLIYFSGLTYALLASMPALPRSGKWLLALGGIASLGFLGIMASEQKWCLYCLGVHVCNLALVGVSFTSRPESQTRRWWTTFVVSSVATALLLLLIDTQVARQVASEQRAQTEESIDQVLDQLTSEAGQNIDSPPADGGFSGHHHRGPEEAAVRLVVFHDYQCGDCAELDAELETMLNEFPTLSISVRHFPLCQACNASIPWDFFHKNACQAAYIAEAAGKLGGEEAFWKMHRWLFEHKAKYEADELQTFCQQLGLDSAEVLRLAEESGVQQIVQRDIELGNTLGATGTPFVFLNGIEVRGTSSNPGNARLAVERVLAENPPLRTAAWDRQPPVAEQRLLTEWEAEEPVELPPQDAARYVFGNPQGARRMLLFLEPTDRDTPELWRRSLKVLEQEPDVRLEVYLYPIHSQLNPKYAKLKQEIFPRSAEITLLIESLQKLAPEKSVAVFSWVLSTPSTLTGEELLQAAANEFAVSLSELQQHVTEPLSDALGRDFAQAEVAGVSWAPTLIVNQRSAPTAAVSEAVIRKMLATGDVETTE
ncbi:MAG: DsbA family protein [Planctomycetaceae bacterium]